MNRVSIVTGIAGAGKTDCLLDRYSAALDAARSDRLPGCTLWLTPTRRVQKWVLQQLAKRQPTGCFAANVLTFDLFAQKILLAAGSPAKPVSSVMKRLLVRRITGQMNGSNQLQHFRSIADTTGFLDIVSSFISELKREEIWPEKFVEACRDRKSAFAQRDRELGQIYATYQQHLADQNWYDNEGRFWLARNALEQGQRTPFASVRMLAVDGFTDFTQTQYEILGHLASWIADVNISIPTETPVIRSELFSKPQMAIKRIKDHLPKSTQTDIQQPKACLLYTSPSPRD